MSIQGSIVSLLNTVGVAARLNPKWEEAQKHKNETKNLAAQEAAINKQLELAIGARSEDVEELGNELSEVKRKQFELNPTAESYKAYQDTKTRKGAVSEPDPEEVGQALAEKEDFEQEVREYADLYRKTPTTAQRKAQEEATKKAEEAQAMEQERKRQTREETAKALGVNLNLPPRSEWSKFRKGNN
jgi:myosin heavy subunit